MIIANVRSQQDLQGKRNTQAQMLEISASNEAELEKRVKDYKNPNKPLAVAPEYKTNAQLQSDRLAQEKQAIVNMGDLGFDYNKSADLVAWLSSSLINKLVEFNANFKGIKKELTETTNPKLINLDFLKNYLEKYFEDLDVNFGRKFSTKQVEGIAPTSSVDELTTLLPSNDDVGRLRDIIIQIQTYIRQGLIVPFNARLQQLRNDIAQNELSDADVRGLGEREKRRYKEEIKNRYEESDNTIRALEEYGETLDKLRLNSILLELYQAIIPDDEVFTLLKTSLSQNERADLIRRYMGVLKTLRLLSRDGVLELTEEADDALRTENMPSILRLANKGIKSLAFVSNDNGVNQISKLQRDYEVMLNQSGKVGDLDKITRLNAIREGEIQVARQNLNAFNAEGATRRDGRFLIQGAFQTAREDQRNVVMRTTDPRNMDNRIQTSLEEQLELYDEAVAQVGEDRARALVEQAQREEERRHQAREQERVGDIQQGARALRPAQPIQVAKTPAQALDEYRGLAGQYYQQFIDEIRARFNESQDSGIIMLERFLFEPNKLGIPRSEKPVRKNRPNQEYFNMLEAILNRWIIDNRIRPLTLDKDFAEPTIVADYYRNNGQRYADGRQTIRGVGFFDKLKQPRGIGSIDPVSGLTRTGEMITKGRGNMKITIEHEGKEKEHHGGELGFKHTRVKVGKGISVKETPSYKHFGKYVIHMGHLLDKNVANFKYPSLGSIPSIKPLTISEDYKEFLIDTLENQKPNERLFTKLPNEEQRHFEKVVSGAGLIDTFKLKRNQGNTEKEEANRFNLLRGEVLAGNNNEKLMKELRGLILRFMSDGRIQQKEGTTMLVELSAL
jgi:hypothetical protein